MAENSGMDKHKIKTILLVNWGIGEKILEALHQDERVDIHTVITRFKKNSVAPWKNCVYLKAKELKYNIISQKRMDWEKLKALIMDNDIDLLVVHAFKRILPPGVFNAPQLGTINIHPSLLPDYRGPDPSRLVLENKETETGITSHYIDEGVDTGNILSQESIDVASHDTRESLIEKMKSRIKKLMTDTIDKIIRGEKGIPQPDPHQVKRHGKE